jgi:hypothetical protein
MDEKKSGSAPYSGPERRRRRVFVTKHHEYHCKDGVCVAVRDLVTGDFLAEHSAIGRKVSGSIVLKNGGIAAVSKSDTPEIGQRIHFALNAEDSADVLTSPLATVERPAMEILEIYDRADESVAPPPGDRRGGR